MVFEWYLLYLMPILQNDLQLFEDGKHRILLNQGFVFVNHFELFSIELLLLKKQLIRVYDILQWVFQ